jgi:hypothetical protein
MVGGGRLPTGSAVALSFLWKVKVMGPVFACPGLFHCAESSDQAVGTLPLSVPNALADGRATYLGLVNGLLSANRTEELHTLMRDIQRERGNFAFHDIVTCNKVLTDCAGRRRLDEARAFLLILQDLGITVDHVSYNIVMDLALKVRPTRQFLFLSRLGT